MISTHILDLHTGNPAAGVTVVLNAGGGDKWQQLDKQVTNSDGRISFQCPNTAGTYQLVFFMSEYLKKKNMEPFFVEAPIVFQITDTKRKYHIPLLLSPFGYSTYRGS